ncbi:glycosyltransferase [Marinobacter salsuginis]|uniref:Glycosyltransferase 2-like domain-containing protein n=1 Tax=Marinobacter salsuginis TaxID=418719 RepID=A0A5M3Q4J9_9GAMM|nr:glycosyltransferase [Marinobacter salsuginis]GBO90153.1 hypothetical protein MSSD14B_38210 [Marinobacter salsuginis]
MSSNVELSFIIPALNEEKNIGNTIHSIHKATGSQACEIIVCDNGSKDRTIEIAESLHATVIVDKFATIAGLRNAGVKNATGAVLVFIDADVQLAEDWLQNLELEIEKWPQDRLIVTGSTCLIPSTSSFVEKNWFAKLTRTATNYINSGHLIVSREMFEKIGGFDQTLKTAEDYDFCQRAKDSNGRLMEAQSLKAYHYGFPTTLWAFCSREAWHGREDFSSLRKFARSKTAITAALNITFLSLSLITYALTFNVFATLVFLFLSIILSLTLTGLKFGMDSPGKFLKTTICCELYLLSRAFSVFYRQTRPSQRE